MSNPEQVDCELTGTIQAKSLEDLAGIVLPFLDVFELSQGRYRHTLYDDGDHLYVEFNDKNHTTLWFQNTGKQLYVLHLTKDQPSD